MIDKFFYGELKVQIMKYCKKLESIREEYDVLVFMARKSICFYDALLLNGEIGDSEANVVITTSSRILSYDCEFLRHKKIALIDDIVLRGNTLYETINFLIEKNIKEFDVYYIASQSFESENSKLIEKYLKDPIIELDDNEILVLGNSITSYISASACSYNVDYPVFYMDSENDFFDDYIQKNHCATIPGCISNEETYMYVQNFDCQKYFGQFNLKELEALKCKGKEIIIKFRIFYRSRSEKRKLVVIPIIVLPELSGQEIETIFGVVTTSKLKNMVENVNRDKELGNMLNVIQYILSYQLFISVFCKEMKYDFNYSITNQSYIFPQSYEDNILECLKKCDLIQKDYVSDIVVVDDFFALSEIYRIFFDFIGDRHQTDSGHRGKFVFKDILDYCSRYSVIDESLLIGYVSILFDFAIDSGLLVPEISMIKDKYVRAYRLSEQYELHEKEFDLIIYMYNEYQKKCKKDEMSKILTEKLLVLFFQEVISKILNENKGTKAEEEKPKNLFGITYARFGPVVSDNSTEIGVSKESYLSNRLFDDSRSPYKRLYTKGTNDTKQIKEGKVYVQEVSGNLFDKLPSDWKRKTSKFVNRYVYFEKLFNFYNVFKKTDFIKSFDKFLVISAIGSNKDNQLLSVAAELKIYQNVIVSKEVPEDIINAIDSVIDGIISGVWKYICYKTEEYQKCYAITAGCIGIEKCKLEKYNVQIRILRESIEKLEKIINSSSGDLIEKINTFLYIYKQYYNLKEDDKKYKIIINKFNEVFDNAILCEKILKSSVLSLERSMYKSIDNLCRMKEETEYEYIDIDKFESLFEDKNNTYNRNLELTNTVDKLMDESVFILYEILVNWNYIVENEKKCKITNTDKNNNYLKKIKRLLSNSSEKESRIHSIDTSSKGIKSIIHRFKELEHEIDLLLFCINQYILKNSSNFVSIQNFFVVKRDDGNEIEITDILDAKKKEKSLNEYLGFWGDVSCAAFVKSRQSLQKIEKISEYTGYTLLDYDCERGVNTIIKVGEQCYSKMVKNSIIKILNQYRNKKIKITDGEEIMENSYLNLKEIQRNEDKKIRVCIISIIIEEMSEIIKLFDMKIKNDKYIYWEGKLSEYSDVIIHCYQQNESSNVYSSQLTDYVLGKNYDYYFCVGTAGAVNAKLYDVFIVNQVIYLEKGANTMFGRQYDGKAPEITEKEKNIINTFLTKISIDAKYDFSVDSAPIYCGDNVEKNPEERELIEAKRFARHLVAIDMETFGVFQALRFNQSFGEKTEKFITVIRGVSDKGDDLKNGVYDDGKSSKERKEIAVKNVLKILIEFISFLEELDK